MTEAFYRDDKAALYVGNCLDVLTTLPSESVQTCVTSPPYLGLRDYGNADQIGTENTPDAYVARLVCVFREVRRVLKRDATLWLNLGDSYAANWSSLRPTGGGGFKNNERLRVKYPPPGMKSKDLLMIPALVAIALRDDGWYLRSDIIWAKPNPMPESVRDRPTKAHEHLFLLAKSPKYFYDADAIREPAVGADRERSDRFGGATGHTVRHSLGSVAHRSEMRNKRDVWTVTTRGFKGAHFATFPPALITPCILAGSRPGDTVLDPFAGSGTTLMVASEHDRKSIGIELNPDYAELVIQRLQPTEAKQRGAA